jgi:hypothetical protein
MTASAPTRKAVAERRTRVLALRAAGAGWAQIARSVPGLSSAKAAAQDCRRALKAQAELLELTDQFSGVLEAERLDGWQRHLEAVLANASGGGDGRMGDPGLVIRCVGRLLELERIRAALAGGEVEPDEGPTEIDRIIAQPDLRVIQGGDEVSYRRPGG